MVRGFCAFEIGVFVDIKKLRELEVELCDAWFEDWDGEDFRPMESPIEKIFWMNLMRVKIEDFPHLWDEMNLLAADFQYCINKRTGKSFGQSEGFPEDYYILDFGLHYTDFARPKNHVQIAVELDGHDFHEKTKEQAQRDKEKDRWLQSQGWIVARFTGSEVWNDPDEVIHKIERMGRIRLRDMAKATG